MKERDLNSKSRSSMARMTPAIGVLNVADIPAAAPHASKTLRSAAVARAAPGGDTQTGIVLLRKSRRWSAAFPVGAGSYAPAYIEKTHTRDRRDSFSALQ